MGDGDVSGNGQAQAGSPGRSGAGLIQAGEPVEDALPVVLRHPRAVILDDQA